MQNIEYQDLPLGMFEKLNEFENYIGESSLEFGLLELMRLRVAQLNGCAYCVDMHYKELKHIGESELRLASLCVWKETPFYNEKERVVLQFAEELTVLNSASELDPFIALLFAHFSKKQVAYLTLAIAQINTWTRLMRSFKFKPGHYKVQN
ncbi:MAG: carboxymuconolactone decarboxylase family protein [Saprospiraceae bacterium]|nr:carboxymuconolactone decarboxylase family protein [Saprospiraceae bacterium]